MSGGGQKIKVRETITKTGDRQIQHGVEVDSGKGFQSVLEETCRK
jgi:hypothetical protein